MHVSLTAGSWMTVRHYHDEIIKPTFFLFMGGLEALFVVWHTCTLTFFVCCRQNTCNKVIHWLLRIFHPGAVLLLALMIYMGMIVWPAFPDIFLWTWITLFVFLSMISKYITLIYWTVELVVDLSKTWWYCQQNYLSVLHA